MKAGGIGTQTQHAPDRPSPDPSVADRGPAVPLAAVQRAMCHLPPRTEGGYSSLRLLIRRAFSPPQGRYRLGKE